MKSASIPRVLIKVDNPALPSALLDSLYAQFNKPTLSDIKFVINSNDNSSSSSSNSSSSSGNGSQELYAHKLILALNSEVFRTMFSGGMKESMTITNTNNNVDTRTTIIMAEWVDYDAAWLMLRYLYTGKIDEPKKNRGSNNNNNNNNDYEEEYPSYYEEESMRKNSQNDTSYNNFVIPGIALYPLTERSTDIVCCLLRLADQYFLQYLKQW